MSRLFGYARVSTDTQQTDNQIQEIKAAGFNVDPKRMLVETVSGSSAACQRPVFMKLLDRMESGDVLVVSRLDRLGRNTVDILQTVERLANDGIRVHCLALGGVDLTSPAGRMTMGVIAAVAQFERDLLIERTRAGQSRAMAAGREIRPQARAFKRRACESPGTTRQRGKHQRRFSQQRGKQGHRHAGEAGGGSRKRTGGEMTNTDKVLDYIKKTAPSRRHAVTNEDIRAGTGVNPHQQVFQITRRLRDTSQISGEMLGKQWVFWAK